MHLPEMCRLLLLLTLAAVPLFSHAIEEPDYAIIKAFDKVEVRQYAPTPSRNLRGELRQK